MKYGLSKYGLSKYGLSKYGLSKYGLSKYFSDTTREDIKKKIVQLVTCVASNPILFWFNVRGGGGGGGMFTIMTQICDDASISQYKLQYTVVSNIWQTFLYARLCAPRVCACACVCVCERICVRACTKRQICRHLYYHGHKKRIACKHKIGFCLCFCCDYFARTPVSYVHKILNMALLKVRSKR